MIVLYGIFCEECLCALYRTVRPRNCREWERKKERLELIGNIPDFRNILWRIPRPFWEFFSSLSMPEWPELQDTHDISSPFNKWMLRIESKVAPISANVGKQLLDMIGDSSWTFPLVLQFQCYSWLESFLFSKLIIRSLPFETKRAFLSCVWILSINFYCHLRDFRK